MPSLARSGFRAGGAAGAGSAGVQVEGDDPFPDTGRPSFPPDAASRHVVSSRVLQARADRGRGSSVKANPPRRTGRLCRSEFDLGSGSGLLVRPVHCAWPDGCPGGVTARAAPTECFGIHGGRHGVPARSFLAGALIRPRELRRAHRAGRSGRVIFIRAAFARGIPAGLCPGSPPDGRVRLQIRHSCDSNSHRFAASAKRCSLRPCAPVVIPARS